MHSRFLKPLPSWVPLVILLGMSAAYLYALASALRAEYWQEWLEASGHIERVNKVSSGSFGLALGEFECFSATYSYVLPDGVAHRSNVYAQGTECIPPTMVVAFIQHGADPVSVKVHYLASSPDIAVMERGFGVGRALMYGLVGLVLFGLIVAVIGAQMRGASAANNSLKADGADAPPP